MFKKVLTAILLCTLFMTGWADAASVNPLSQGFIEGYLQQINLPQTVTDSANTTAKTGKKAVAPASTPAPVTSLDIQDYSGADYNFAVADNACFTIDNIPAKLSDFRPGMEIYAKLQGKSIILLEGYSTTQLGYIAPGSKVRTGTVTKIDRDTLELLLSTGDKITCYTSSATVVSRNGTSTTLDSLYEGDWVKCFYDNPNDNIISRINIEGSSILVDNVYQGSLKTVDAVENAVILGNLKVLNNGQWTDLTATRKIYYNDQAPIFMGGQSISTRNLKYYQGKTVYAATKDFFGREQIEKMVLKNQYESKYEGQIKNVNWYTDALELSNNKNLTFNDGTIIIKNGRLVDKYALNEDNDALVMADSNGGGGIANIISVYNVDVNNSNIGQHYIYAGRMDQIFQDTVLLTDFFTLNQNVWESFDEEKELYYDNDTGIYDLEEGQEITPQEFYSKDYAVDEDSERVEDNNLEDWHAYIYTDGDRIVSIAVQKNMDSLLSQRVTNGTIAAVQDDSLTGWTITVREAKDWSNLHERWMARSSNLKVSLGQALVIKNNQIISPQQLTAGDRIYMVRDDFEAKIAIVK